MALLRCFGLISSYFGPPLLTYYNTGWWQFGYRFSLDFMMILLLLLAYTAGRKTFMAIQITYRCEHRS